MIPNIQDTKKYSIITLLPHHLLPQIPHSLPNLHPPATPIQRKQPRILQLHPAHAQHHIHYLHPSPQHKPHPIYPLQQQLQLHRHLRHPTPRLQIPAQRLSIGLLDQHVATVVNLCLKQPQHPLHPAHILHLLVHQQLLRYPHHMLLHSYLLYTHQHPQQILQRHVHSVVTALLHPTQRRKKRTDRWLHEDRLLHHQRLLGLPVIVVVVFRYDRVTLVEQDATVRSLLEVTLGLTFLRQLELAFNVLQHLPIFVRHTHLLPRLLEPPSRSQRHRRQLLLLRPLLIPPPFLRPPRLYITPLLDVRPVHGGKVVRLHPDRPIKPTPVTPLHPILGLHQTVGRLGVQLAVIGLPQTHINLRRHQLRPFILPPQITTIPHQLLRILNVTLRILQPMLGRSLPRTYQTAALITLAFHQFDHYLGRLGGRVHSASGALETGLYVFLRFVVGSVEVSFDAPAGGGFGVAGGEEVGGGEGEAGLFGAVERELGGGGGRRIDDLGSSVSVRRVTAPVQHQIRIYRYQRTKPMELTIMVPINYPFQLGYRIIIRIYCKINPQQGRSIPDYTIIYYLGYSTIITYLFLILPLPSLTQSKYIDDSTR